MYRLLFFSVAFNLCLRYDSFIEAFSSLQNVKYYDKSDTDISKQRFHHNLVEDKLIVTNQKQRVKGGGMANINNKKFDFEDGSDDDSLFEDSDGHQRVGNPTSNTYHGQNYPTSVPSAPNFQGASLHSTVSIPSNEPSSLPSALERTYNNNTSGENEDMTIDFIDMKTMSIILKLGNGAHGNEKIDINMQTQLNIIQILAENLRSHMSSFYQENSFTIEESVDFIESTVSITDFVIGSEIPSTFSQEKLNRVEPLVFYYQEGDIGRTGTDNKSSSLHVEIVLWCVAEYQRLNFASKGDDITLTNNTRQELATEKLKSLQEHLFSFQDETIKDLNKTSLLIQQAISKMGSLRMDVTDIEISFNPGRQTLHNNQQEEKSQQNDGGGDSSSPSPSMLKLIGITAMCFTCLVSLSFFVFVVRNRSKIKTNVDLSAAEPSHDSGIDSYTNTSYQLESSQELPEDSVVKEFQKIRLNSGCESNHGRFESFGEAAMSSDIGHSVLESLISSCNRNHLNDILIETAPIPSETSQGMQHHDVTVNNDISNGKTNDLIETNNVENNTVDQKDTKPHKGQDESECSMSSTVNSQSSFLSEFSPIQSQKRDDIIQEDFPKNPTTTTTNSNYPPLSPRKKQQQKRRSKFDNRNTPRISEDKELDIKTDIVLSTIHSQEILDEFEDHVSFMITRNSACSEI